MFYTLIFIFMTFGRESETSFIKVDTNESRQLMERLLHGYMDKISKMTMHFPNHDVQLQFELSGKLPAEPSSLPSRRSGVKVFKFPKKIIRSENISTTLDNLSTTTSTTNVDTSSPTAPTSIDVVRQSEDTEKTPIYLEDLKNVLDEFEKKLALHSNCNGHHGDTPQSSTGQVHYPSQPTDKTHRNIQDILQLIGKGVTVDYNIPNPTDNDMDWLQIKIPNKI